MMLFILFCFTNQTFYMNIHIHTWVIIYDLICEYSIHYVVTKIMFQYNMYTKTGSTNSLFSTAVISGSSSAPDLKDLPLNSGIYYSLSRLLALIDSQLSDRTFGKSRRLDNYLIQIQ